MSFKILFSPESKKDIQHAIAWYNKQKKGLGKEFYEVFRENVERIRQNPFFQVRYDNVRCLPVKKYPFMIHYSIEEVIRLVIIIAVFNTALNPERWKSID